MSGYVNKCRFLAVFITFYKIVQISIIKLCNFYSLQELRRELDLAGQMRGKKPRERSLITPAAVVIIYSIETRERISSSLAFNFFVT